MRDLQLIVFDWGNVLVRYRPLGFVRLAQVLGAPLNDVVDAFMADGLFSALQVGQAGSAALVGRLADRFGVAVRPEVLVACFEEDMAEPMPGMRALVEQLRGQVPLALLSNTFFAHWELVLQDRFYQAFEHRIGSHIVGACKPEAAVFAALERRSQVPPDRVLFFDDSPRHVAAARAWGWDAHVFRDAAQVAECIGRHLAK